MKKRWMVIVTLLVVSMLAVACGGMNATDGDAKTPSSENGNTNSELESSELGGKTDATEESETEESVTTEESSETEESVTTEESSETEESVTTEESTITEENSATEENSVTEETATEENSSVEETPATEETSQGSTTYNYEFEGIYWIENGTNGYYFDGTTMTCIYMQEKSTYTYTVEDGIIYYKDSEGSGADLAYYVEGDTLYLFMFEQERCFVKADKETFEGLSK